MSNFRIKNAINIGDKVICGVSGVVGIVEKFYYPTSLEEQTMILIYDLCLISSG